MTPLVVTPHAEHRADLPALLEAELSLERAVLGAILIEPDLLASAVALGVTPGQFHKDSHGYVFAAMCRLVERGEGIDVRLVAAEVQAAAAVPDLDLILANALEDATVPALFQDYVGRLRDVADKRRLARACHFAAEAALNGEPAAAVRERLLRELEAVGAPAGIHPPTDAPVLVPLNTVTPEVVDWAWRGRLARSKLTLLIGDPGVGKSYMSIDVAARISVGGVWPDGLAAPSGSVLILSAEDGPARRCGAGAAPDRRQARPP